MAVPDCRQKVEDMIAWCGEHDVFAAYMDLFLLAYCFLLRLPSEALPAAAGENSGPSSLFMEDGKLVLALQCRKNKLGGSRLVRGCWCKESKATCPLHRLGPLVENTPHGQPLFPGISAASALGVLREILFALGTEKAHEYRTHDFRRGHAQDLVDAGQC